MRLQFLTERLEAITMIRIFAIFKRFLRPRHEKQIGHSLYVSCVDQSRLPVFYLDYGVEDEKGARFELLNLHVSLVVNALRRVDESDSFYEQAKETAQSLFDTYLLALDTTMREDGVGDLSVPKKMKKLSALIYTRFKAWDELMHNSSSSLSSSLADYLKRTVYAGTALDPNYQDDLEDVANVDPERVAALETYLRSAFLSLDVERILRAEVAWPIPVTLTV